MNNFLLSLSSWFSHISELLGTYLLPIAIAIPLAIVLYIFGTRKGDDGPTSQLPPAQPPQPRPVAAPIPAAAPVQRAAAPVVPAAAAPAGPISILVVDDSAVVRAKLRKLFEAAGLRVETANDGVEALEKLAGAHFSVLLTDLEMPNMNGVELIAAVHGSLDTEDLPVLAITGHDELQARVNDYAGVYGIFKKPWNDRELLKRVETLSSLRRAPAAA